MYISFIAVCKENQRPSSFGKHKVLTLKKADLPFLKIYLFNLLNEI